MCGIAGVISKTILTPQDILTSERMESRLFHRGPDGHGQFIDEHVALRMRRLSIIDLEHGWQPLWNEDRSIVLVANGEIYNFIELKTLLKSRGHGFRTNSDCETIIHLYEEFGSSFYTYLRGMFAFCLYDIKRKKILIFRDRMGEKPLYYYQNNDCFYFSSELKSLLSSGNIPFDLDHESVNDYFYYQFVPEPRTPLKNVFKISPGSYLEINLNSWSIKEFLYWKMEDSPEVDTNPAEAIKNELELIHKLQIRSDVPVGVALSGGLDSSSIASLATKYYPGTIQAFSVGYPGRPENDERSEAMQLAEKLGIPIHEIELKSSDLIRDFEKLNYFRDEPVADISGYGYFSISREAKKNGVSVLLQGQGGDELFWGYAWVVEALKITERYNNHNNVSNLLYHLKEYFPNKKGKKAWIKWFLKFGYIFNIHDRMKLFGKGAKNSIILYENTPDFQIANRDFKKYTTNNFQKSLSTNSPFKYNSGLKVENNSVLFTKLICDSYLLQNGIIQGDRLSMASSVELRLPFVDYKLVELVIGLRKNKKYEKDYENFPKPWLRSSMTDILPSEIMNRPKKGFAPPVSEWYRMLFGEYGNQLVNGELVNEQILNIKGAKTLSKGPIPKGSVMPISFKALVFENWMRQMKKIISESQN